MSEMGKIERWDTVTFLVLQKGVANHLDHLLYWFSLGNLMQGWLQQGRRGVTPLAKYDPAQEL